MSTEHPDTIGATLTEIAAEVHERLELALVEEDADARARLITSAMRSLGTLTLGAQMADNLVTMAKRRIKEGK